MLVFIHINKTAGRTVRYILRSSFGLRHCDVEPWQDEWSEQPFSSNDLRRLRKLYPNLESIAGHRVTGYAELKENGAQLDYFSFMRDPLKTCASRFQYNVQFRKKKDLVFEEWIQNDWTRNQQTKRIAGVADVNEAIRIIQEKKMFIGLTERFDESMLLLKSLVDNRLNISYKRINVARTNTLAEKLLSDERSKQILVEANQVDLELYDFVKHEIFPSFQREYGPALEGDVADYQKNRVNKFNTLRLEMSRLKQYLFYKPLLYLYRNGVKVV